VSLPIRIRLTLATTASVVLIVLLGAVIFANQVREGLIGGVDADLQVRAGPLAEAVREGSGADRVPMPQDLLLQVFDARGDLAKSSPSLEGRVLLSAEQRRAVREGSRSFTVRLREDTRVLAVPIRRPEGTWVMVVGSSLGPQYAMIADVTGDLVLGALLITLVGAVGAWLLAGAALRPVEQMRREAALISERDPGAPACAGRERGEAAGPRGLGQLRHRGCR
jgi:two-component system OmpR family sensor kinase